MNKRRNAHGCTDLSGEAGLCGGAVLRHRGWGQVRCISAIHYEPDAIYFFTARGKDFCRELLDTGKVQVLGYTMYKEMIRLTGTVKPAPAEEQ